jgi:hypothetical protein
MAHIWSQVPLPIVTWLPTPQVAKVDNGAVVPFPNWPPVLKAPMQRTTPLVSWTQISSPVRSSLELIRIWSTPSSPAGAKLLDG